MADRRRQIVQLLGSRHDGIYLPAGSLVTPAGLVPAEREPCAVCGGILLRDDFGKEIRRRKGRGWIYDRYRRRQPCTACDEAGWIARDPMDTQHVRVGSSTTTSTARPVRTVMCDACAGDGVRLGQRCARCEGEGRRPLHVFELQLDTSGERSGDALTDAIESRTDSGSYLELDRALAALRTHDRDAHTRLLAAIDTHLAPLPDDCEPALAFLDARMPDPIRVPAQVVANAREQAEWRRRVKGRAVSNGAVKKRDQDVRALIRSGVPTQRVAFEYGLSVSQVNRIVRGDAA